LRLGSLTPPPARTLFVLVAVAVAGVVGVAASAAFGLGPRRPDAPVARPWSGLGEPPGAPPSPSLQGAGGDDGGAEATGGHAELYKQRGVALGLFAEDVSFSYAPLLREIAALGATHVSLVVPVYQTNGRTSDLALHTRFSPTLGLVADTVRAARRERLEVTIFPIVRLSEPAPGEWRGTLAPRSLREWFRRYGELLGDLAAVAAQTGATRLVVGSELSTLDGQVEAWRPLLERVRAIFPGRLVYSANWDHFRGVPLFDLVDEDGVVAYFPLRESARGADDAQALTAAWRSLQGDILAWHRGNPHPLVLTELGYRSRVGATAQPWDESPGGVVDLEEQRRAFAAFHTVWTGTTELDGVYVWNWYGFGGTTSQGYTPRGKPAAEEVRRLLHDL
jgi:hypothetical protein